MNKIYKVMYSKVKQCAVVVSEIAKSHGHNGESSSVRKHAALMVAVLIALGSLSIEGMPVAQADANAHNNDFIGANDYYWYWDKNDNKWEQNTYRDLLGHLQRKTLPNNEGAGAKETGSIASGLYAQAGMQTVTIGNRNAGQSRGSVFIGEHSGYDDKAGNIPQGSSNNYVTSVGFQSDATGWGSIAIGSNATAKNTKKTDVAVTMTGNTDEDKKNGIYEIEKNPMIEGASVALGYSAQAKDGNIAIGAYSEATKDLSADTSEKAKSYLTGMNATSYVSVGSSDVQRRISNVADGAADSDAATIAQLKKAVFDAGSGKANIDASNIGNHIKVYKMDEQGKVQLDGNKNPIEDTDATTTAQNTNKNAWGTAIGTGSIANSNTNGSGQLVTGTTVYNYVSPKAVDGKKLEYISEDKSTGTNLGILDDKVSTNATDITGLKSLSNITDNGKTVIKKAAVGAVKVTAGDRITVTPDSKNLTDADTVTYTISAKNDGKVASGNSGLVSGDTVYQALQNQTKSLTYNGGWGINIDSSKKISLKNNLTTVIYDNGSSSSKDVKFNIADTAMAIGGAIFNNSGWTSYVDGKTMTINSTGRYSVRLGGINNSTTGIYSTVTGGSANVASGYASSVNGGKNNTASGKYATVIGGGYLWTEAYENGDFPDVDESIFGSDASSYRNDASGILSTIIGGYGNKASGKNSLIVGGLYNEAGNESASIFGGGGNRADGDRTTISGGANNFAVGDYSNVSGGIANTTEGRFSTISGGYGNIIVDEGPMQPNRTYYGFPASGKYGSAFGGGYNVVGGENGTAVGGGHSVVYGIRSVGLAGGSTGLGAHYALAAGYQSVVTTKGSKLLVSDKRNEFTDDYYYDNHGYAYKILGKEQNSKHLDFIPEYEDVATAVGYQATANEPDTISFGHDVGDVSGYDVKWKERTDKDEWGNINTNPDGTINDYAKKPDIIINHYDTAKYNRLVKVADGINNHDVVVMEQLRNADNVGKNAKNNVVVYKKNTNGTLQVDENGEAVIDVDASKAATEKATEQAIKDSGDAWGRALGTGKVEANNSQLVTGDTVYNAIQNQAEWKLTTNGESADKAVTIKPGTTVDFSAEKNTKEHSNVTISHKGSNVTIGLDKDIVLGDTTPGNGGSLNVYSDSSDGNNQSNHVSINGSTISVNYPKTVEGKTSDARGVILGVGEEDSKPDGYIAFNNVEGGYTYLHASTDASDDKKGRLEYVGNDGKKKYIANLDDVSTAVNNAKTKYYSVNENLPKIDGYTNEGNDGAKGMGSIAAGFNTHADGIASTVAGSYSGVLNQDSKGAFDLRGATALSYGTFNINQNTDATKEHSGVANSIVGQANATIDSNAAIIYGAGNTVTNSYRAIDTSKFDLSKVKQDIAKKDAAAVAKDLQEAVPTSGGQVMVMGGGNSVDKAYMTQVTGVGNKVSGNDSTYTEGTSTQYNFVDGFQNELTNGKHDYIIGSNNKVSGDSVGTNQSNIIFGDNHKLNNQKNNVIIGFSDTADDETAASDVVIIGHNAKVSAEGGVAIGSGSVVAASTEKVSGYDPTTKAQSTDKTSSTWNATTGAVSIGTADGTVTRQINGVAAGTNDTDAVNVAQLKSLQSGLTEDLTGKGLKFAANSGEVYTAELGSTVKIQGTAKKPGHEYTADNLTTVIDDSGKITILMDKNISADKIAVNGKDGKDAVSISGKDGVGHIGLTGPAGTNGMKGADGQPGASIDITVKNGYNEQGKDGKDGINGEKGVDGTSLTRVVYTDKTGEHQIATMEDGLKFKGDDGKEISKKLNNTLEIIGGANRENLTDGNIGVNSTDKGQLKVQLAKDLKGITSISNQKTEGDKTTGAKIDLGTDGSVDVNGGKITNVGSGADESGSYTTTTNAANIGDVQKIVKNAVDSASDTTNKALAGKANIDATNIGANLKGADGKAASAEDQKANAEKWGSAIGTGKIEKDNGQLVTGKTVYEYNKPIAEDGKSLHYVSEQYTTGQNLSALDAHVKDNADAITQINTSISTLDQNAVKYDDSTKSKITLAGGGTTITNVKDGKLSDDSTEAVNGRQLNAVQKQVTNNTTEITKIENGEGFTDAGETVIKNLSKDAVQVNAGTAITVAGNVDDKGNKTYTISANNNGTVANGDGNLISGDTLYKEVHVDKDGSYIKGSQSVGKNLSALDSGLKTTSDLIHTNDKGDIQIGGSSTATKIDVSGKDAKGNTTGRFITGVVTDAGDPTSAANVGYVNGVTAANTQQIYRDMNNAYGRLNNNINKAAAGSNALAALHPLDYDPDDKADFAVGYGHYRNANAAAVGAFYHPNENTMVNVGVSLGNGDPGFNAGVSFKIGSGSAGHQAMSKTEMAKVINSQSKEIDALKKDNADKDKRIDALEQKMAEILAKLDKNGK